MRRSWSLRDIFVLRHPGFPFDWLEGLAVSSEVHSEIAKLFDAERALVTAAAAQSARVGLATAKSVRRHEMPPPPLEVSGEWSACYSAWLVQRARAEAAFHADRVRLQHRLHALASDERIQEAVFLSSPDMFENVWCRYVGGTVPLRNSASHRRTERLVYSYLQRFCAKNETTSFFGPMGYGAIDGDDDAIEFLPAGDQKRRTFIAYWAVEALASAVATEPELWGMLPIRRSPLFTVDEKAAEARCESLGLVESLGADQLRVLGAVARLSDARAIASDLGADVAWVETVAMSLFVKGILIRRIWFRSDHWDALSNLRRAVESLSPCPTRDRWLSHLAELDELRSDFEKAPLRRRRVLLPILEALFSRLARTPPRRAGGHLYTDRLILNEEASSPFQVRVGRRAAARLASALTPALELCASFGEQVQKKFSRRVVAELERIVLPISFDRYAALLRGIAASLPPAPTVTTGVQDVFDLDEAFLPASEDGARFALPDLCLGRGAHGALHPILSSVHHHLLTDGWLFTFHSAPARIEKMVVDWIAGHMKHPLVELATGRHNKGFYSFPGPRAARAAAELVGGRGNHQVFPASELGVHLENGRPVLRGVDGNRIILYSSLADLTLHPPFTALSAPPVVLAPIRNGDSHVPRLDAGGATYQRERWEVPVADWKSLSGFALFAAVQRERQSLGLPRFVFARVPSERKPFLVDIECPFAVELLKHLTRDSLTIGFEEMLPAPEQLWLRDERGRYTFELRIQAQRE